jgi:acetyl esterase/lipase
MSRFGAFRPGAVLLACSVAWLPLAAQTVTKNLVYAVRGTADTLRYDLYVPAPRVARADAAGWPTPLLIFAHGGTFSEGRRDDAPVADFARSLSERGIAVACISYRLTLKGTGMGCDVPAARKRAAIAAGAQDLLAAVEYLLGKGLPAGCSRSSVVIGGTSAGAHAALHAAFRMRASLPEPLADALDGVVSFAGALEAPAPARGTYPALLAIHGTCDGLVPYGEAIHRFCPESPDNFVVVGGGGLQGCLADAGSPAALLSVTGAGHEVASKSLMDPAIQDRVADFVRTVSRGRSPSYSVTLPGAKAAKCPPSRLPCN